MQRSFVYTVLLFAVLLPQALPAQDVWIRRNLPIHRPVDHLAVAPNGDIYAQIEFEGMFRSTDEGVSWEELIVNDSAIAHLNLGRGSLGDLICDVSGNLYLTSGSWLWRSTNEGGSWERMFDSKEYCIGIRFDSGYRMYVTTREYGILTSDDSGRTMTAFPDTLPPYGFSPYSVLHITSEDHLFAGHGPYLIRSTDRGQTWENIYSMIPGQLDLYAVFGICSDPAGNLYFGISREQPPPGRLLDYYVIRSTDYGDTWIDSNIESGPIGRMGSIAPGNIILATGTNYVRRSTDFGNTWHHFYEGMDNSLNLDLAFTPDGRAVVGSNGCIFITKRPVGITDEPTPAPISLSLAQSYPNPVGLGAQSAVIEYALPRGGYVSLSVYDLSGRLVQTLVDTHQSPGQHSTAFNTGGLPAGLYIYRLSAEGQTITKKLSLVR